MPKIESTVRCLGVEVDDALEMSEQTEVWTVDRTVASKAAVRSRRYASREQRGRIMANFTHLSSFSNFAVGCGVLDGDWVLIDAVSNGKRLYCGRTTPVSRRRSKTGFPAS